eukprot:19523-Heterococcus_DN1.PRE.1
MQYSKATLTAQCAASCAHSSSQSASSCTDTEPVRAGLTTRTQHSSYGDAALAAVCSKGSDLFINALLQCVHCLLDDKLTSTHSNKHAQQHVPCDV